MQQGVMQAAADEIVDDHGMTRNPQGFDGEVAGICGFEVMKKQGTGDDVERIVGKRKIESVSDHAVKQRIIVVQLR